MGTFSIWHWLIVLAVVLVLFGGGGKISKLMGDFGKGLKSFKKNIKEEGVGDDVSETDKAEIDKAIASEEPKKSMDSASSDNKDRAANG
jgi:sec-independent protein translocase protein TatA